jgi:hypothetical protein
MRRQGEEMDGYGGERCKKGQTVQSVAAAVRIHCETIRRKGDAMCRHAPEGRNHAARTRFPAADV